MAEDGLNPKEREAYDRLLGLIQEELGVQLSIGRLSVGRVSDPEGVETIASLITDVVWRVFDVTPRTAR